jgi:hypothetical protein
MRLPGILDKQVVKELRLPFSPLKSRLLDSLSPLRAES